jgi:hypothetical protein
VWFQVSQIDGRLPKGRAWVRWLVASPDESSLRLHVSIRGAGLSFRGFLGSAELALGGDDHRDGGKHDDSAEDQESGRFNAGTTSIGKLVDCAVEAGMEDRHQQHAAMSRCRTRQKRRGRRTARRPQWRRRPEPRSAPRLPSLLRRSGRARARKLCDGGKPIPIMRQPSLESDSARRY